MSALDARPARLLRLKIKRVSIVDDPAHQHARIALFKRAQPDEDEDEKEDVLWPEKLSRAWREIHAASERKFPEMTPSAAWRAYRDTAEGRRARRDFEDLRERVHGVRFDDPPKEPATVKMSPADAVHVNVVQEENMKPIAEDALPEALRPRWASMLRRSRLYDGLAAYLASDEGKSAFTNFRADYLRLTGEPLPAVHYDEQPEPSSRRYNAFDPAAGIGGAKGDATSKFYREQPAAYRDHITKTTRDPQPLIHEVNKAVEEAIEPVVRLLKADGLSGPVALDRALALVPATYSWAGQRIREVQAHTVTESGLRGYGDVCKRVTVLADAALSIVRKGAAPTHEAALREVLDGGGHDNAAA